jgi:diguanylate cyclase (GGDEF)-like protein
MSRDLPANANLEHLRKQAKKLLSEIRDGKPAAIEQFRLLAPHAVVSLPKLTEVQHAIAREYGFDSWSKMKLHVESLVSKPASDEAPQSAPKAAATAPSGLPFEELEPLAKLRTAAAFEKLKAERDSGLASARNRLASQGHADGGVWVSTFLDIHVGFLDRLCRQISDIWKELISKKGQRMSDEAIALIMQKVDAVLTDTPRQIIESGQSSSSTLREAWILAEAERRISVLRAGLRRDLEIQQKEEELLMPGQRTVDPVVEGPQDDLLPLYRKIQFERDLQALLGRSGERAPLSLLFFDLDHFKLVNDNYGHLVGDEVLIGVANCAKDVCGSKGRCYRWGGEELAALLPNYNTAEAASLAERIRGAVSKLTFTNFPDKVTVSVGVSCYPETSQNAEKLVEHADAAMYAAKQAGRDQIASAPSVAGSNFQVPSRFLGVGAPQQPPLSAEIVFRRVQQARQELGRASQPNFSLAAWPLQPVNFVNIFESPEAPIVRLLEKPPRLRNGGFDLPTGIPSVILQAQLRRCLVSNHELLEVWRDGALICIVPGDDWHLCWNTHSSADTGLRINTLALAETVYLFCDWVIKAYENAVPAPPKLKIRMMLSDMTMNGKPFSLNPHRVSELWLNDDRRLAPGAVPGIHAEIDVDRVGAKPGILAYYLLSDLYSWFGFNAVDMPYVNREKEPPTIDTSQLI